MTLGIDRQAFQGGVFIGNHIKKAIDGNGPKIITACLEGDKKLQRKYTKLLTQLNIIRKLMNAARFLDDDEVKSLRQACRKLGRISDHYRQENETVTPKFHMLVHHVPQFLKQWRTVGLISEHGLGK
jgi:hypothetical protein